MPRPGGAIRTFSEGLPSFVRTCAKPKETRGVVRGCAVRGAPARRDRRSRTGARGQTNKRRRGLSDVVDIVGIFGAIHENAPAVFSTTSVLHVTRTCCSHWSPVPSTAARDTSYLLTVQAIDGSTRAHIRHNRHRTDSTHFSMGRYALQVSSPVRSTQAESAARAIHGRISHAHQYSTH